MRNNQKVASLVIAVVLGACSDRVVPTALRDLPLLTFDATAAATSSTTDPIGDASLNTKSNVGPGADAKVPEYLDIVRAEISKSGQTFALTMNVAGSVPAVPADASGGLGTQSWLWGLDTDPTTAPQGGFLPPGQPHPAEFFIAVTWDGTLFSAALFDRRPALSGGDPTITPVPFTIAGTQVRVSLEARALGDPATFGWGAATITRHSHYSSEGFQELDRAPDAAWVIWPQ